MSDLLRIETITQVHELLGIDKPKHPLVSVIHARDYSSDWHFADQSLVNGMYMIMLKADISGSIQYGRSSYDFQEGTIVFTGPGQVIRFDQEHAANGHSGWTLLFHPDLIRRSELGRNIDQYSFFDYEVNEALHLSDDEKQSLTELIGKIEKEYSQNIDQHSQKLIIKNIELILDYCTRYYDRQFYTRSNMSQDTVGRFEQLLKGYYRSDQPLKSGLPTVARCGRELGMSPNYLSDMLRKETGRTAQDHIHSFIIEKAKTILLSTNESISAVAYDLGFEYPQHFSKIFRKKTGMSPSEYKQVN